MIGVLVVLGLVIAAGVWVGVRAMMAKTELEALVPLAAPVREAAEARDLDRLRQLLVDVQTHASEAAGLTGDPVWRLAEALPVVGPNMAAVRVVSASADELSSTAAPVLAFAAEAAADDSQWEIIDLADMQQPLAAFAAAFGKADEEFGDLSRDSLIPQVARGVDQIGELAHEGAPLATALSHAADVLPPMLGADGPRTLLVMLQNSAELRTAGGIAGSFVLLSADGGEISIVDQADAAALEGTPMPTHEIPTSTTEFYGESFSRFVQNSTMTPDFDLTAALVSERWAAYSGEAPDAILSLDLTSIAGLLAASGPIVLPDGSEITADDLVSRVLIDAYFDFDREQQTQYQQLVTGAALSRILGGSPDLFAWAESLGSSMAEGRVSVWSSLPDEQAVLADSALGGTAARLTLAGDSAFAVWFNDATAGKMDGFLDVAIDAGSVSCRSDGLADVAVAVTLTNTAPPEAGAEWPWWITGGGIEGVAPGDIATDVSVAGNAQAFLGGVWQNDAIIASEETTDAGFPTARARVTLAPGASQTLEFRFTADGGGNADPVIQHTPLMRGLDVGAFDPVCR